VFLRSVKAANGQHEYLRLVESYRAGDKVKQRVVLHIGRKDLLAPHLDALIRVLQTDSETPRWIAAEQLSTPQAWTWGPVLVARHLFDSLSLGAILDNTTNVLRHGQPLSERVFPLVANRLMRPGSEHALAQWLEDFYVVTRQGRRWVPEWKQCKRVKVSFEQLRLWYETLFLRALSPAENSLRSTQSQFAERPFDLRRRHLPSVLALVRLASLPLLRRLEQTRSVRITGQHPAMPLQIKFQHVHVLRGRITPHKPRESPAGRIVNHRDQKHLLLPAPFQPIMLAGVPLH